MSILESEQRKLFARSGNRCAFTECPRRLTADGSPPDRVVVLGEMAHIVAERPNGPRGVSPLTPEERNRYENLILLCNNHHQLVDSQVATYTVARLTAMKEDHERRIEQALARGEDHSTQAVPSPYVAEVVHSTLLPVVRMPEYVFGAPCDLEERGLQPQLGPLRDNEITPFIIRGRMLYSFQDMSEMGNPFGTVVNPALVQRFPVHDWWSHPDRLGWFIQLLNRVLNKLTGRKGLRLDRFHTRYYFAPETHGVPLSKTYKPLNKRTATRPVVWQPKKKSTGSVRPYWFHRAVSLRFLRTSDVTWALSVRPELHVTSDSTNPIASEKVGARVTRKKSRTFNDGLLADVHFWRDFLSESSPRIILPFGQASQTLVVSSTLMHGDVSWPGIPSEHSKPFENVEYPETLFSSADLQSLEASIGATGTGRWQQDDEDEDDPDPNY